MPEWVGETLSKVRIERQIGRGGMAEVYLGIHTTLDRPVAVKVLHAHLSEDPGLLDRFRAEAQAVAKLRHPNIVQVFDFDVHNDRPFIVMELLEGQSLSSHLKRLHEKEQLLSRDIVLQLASGIASALDYAHTRDIVHRDVKPANVMLRRSASGDGEDPSTSSQFQAVLTDFGIARIASTTTRTATGTIMGTPAYMSPEQVLGKKVDARSDIYSLGIMIYEMLAGVPPFETETDTPASVMYKHVHEPPPTVTHLPGELQRVLERALAKDPSHRYQRAGTMARDLAGSIGPEAIPTARAPDRGAPAPSQAKIESKPPTPPPQAPERGRFPVSWPVLAAVGVVGAVMLIGAIWLGSALLVSGFGGLFGEGPIAAATAPSTDQAPDTPTDPAQEPATVDPAGQPILEPGTRVGEAVFNGPDIAVELTNLPSPGEGSDYEVWLLSEELGPVSLGRIANGQSDASLQFTQSDGRTLLTLASGIVVSIEPAPDSDAGISSQIAFSSSLPSGLLEASVHLEEVTLESASPATIFAGLSQQVTHYDSHLGFAIDAARNQNLAGARQHCEHVINITVGSRSDTYGDWNGDERTENPGDAFGLAEYLTYLQLLAQSEIDSPLSPAAGNELTAKTLQDSEELAQIAQRASGLCQRITSSDTAAEIQPLADELGQLRLEPQVTTLAADASGLALQYRSALVAEGS